MPTGKNHEKRRFAGAGGTDKTRRLALCDTKINALEDVDRPRSARQAEFHAVEFDNRVGQKIAFPVVLILVWQADGTIGPGSGNENGAGWIGPGDTRSDTRNKK